ncbi:antibiotic biosynthesis monooxygenase [Roseobacter cerasinus]|uniref:Antibiotic biosynthesis monooxygenase n=1 Tax=Roseobacter cerasinus TaxID=2602289 RepID=A0A640VPK6_9RHOB|nr:antibiotic biosynthesis monooxygenase family protein [Roseobacter cerasinus]GFE49677.1 antibiotic biosynthesis monooxygenase [Roseobacter cerasinus]
MHALLFEMEPRSGHEGHYFKHAEALRPLLAQHAGLLFIERFKSISRPKMILSHSHWRDEASLAKWRSDPDHHRSQTAGRNKHFSDYRLRISHVLKMMRQDTDPEIWSAEGAYTNVDATPARFLTIVASKGSPVDLGGECFHSVTADENFLCVTNAATRDHGDELIAKAMMNPNASSAMLALVSRDYSMFERAEAPQYFPDAKADRT